VLSVANESVTTAVESVVEVSWLEAPLPQDVTNKPVAKKAIAKIVFFILLFLIVFK
jgi:hypothetical protein